jgi:hypothetical protein
MSVLSNFENTIDGAVDGAAAALFASPIEPAQIAKKAEKQMKREKLVGSGRQYAPTLYNVLVSQRDDKRLFGFYPTMASEIENFLYARGTEDGMEFDSRPLVRFIPDPGLRKGRFDVIAEVVAAPIIRKLRDEELEYYGLASQQPPSGRAAAGAGGLDGRAGLDAAAGVGPGAAAGMAGRAGAAARPAAGLAPSTGGRFSGLDRAADLDNLSDPSGLQDPSGLPALPYDRQDDSGPLHALPGLASEAPEPQQPHGVSEADEAKRKERLSTATATPAPASEPPYEPDNLAAIGNASLYNLSEQRQYRLEIRQLTLGRGKNNDIVLADANASRVHTRLSQDATGKWKLIDLDSTNGTLLNKRLVASAILKSGDEITIGTTVLQFIE